MQTIEYGLPIFGDTDVADLNKYSAQMAKALKGQLDKFGNPLVFKGGVNSIEELPTTAESGEIYNVIDVNKNYIWNGAEWVIYSDNSQVPAVIDNLESTSTTDALSANQGKVLKGLIDNTYTSSEIDAFLNSINVNITSINGNISNLNDTKLNKTVVTDSYSNSRTYSVGDYCIYGNTLYKCTTAITTAENWNSAHWTATTIATELNNSKKTINELENKATKYVQLYGEISSKDIFILSDNVNNYDEIHVFATANKWGHRVTGTIFKHNLSSDMLQIFPFNKNYWEESFKIYETTVDTTSADLIGTENYRILGIYGVKY